MQPTEDAATERNFANEALPVFQFFGIEDGDILTVYRSPQPILNTNTCPNPY